MLENCQNGVLFYILRKIKMVNDESSHGTAEVHHVFCEISQFGRLRHVLLNPKH